MIEGGGSEGGREWRGEEGGRERRGEGGGGSGGMVETSRIHYQVCMQVASSLESCMAGLAHGHR